MRTRHRLLAAAAGLTAACVALSGCLYSLIPESAPTSTAGASPDTDGIAADLLPFYGQQLSWEACGGEGFDCTTVTAPLDWADPAAGEIDLAVIRHRATSGQALGSLLVNPGGPGESGVDFIRDSLNFAVGDLENTFDVVGFDPRGVAASSAVTCFDDAGLDAYFFDVPQNPRGSEAWRAELQARDTAFAQACDANSGGILPFVTTEYSARDLDLLRAVLGDTKLNYLGYSYGTFLGATYAGLFPERVGRLVLDGAVDPSESGLEAGVGQAIGFESALRAYMTDCLTKQDCPFRGTVDEAMADLGTLLASVDRTPLPNADGRELGADSLFTAIVAALYSEETWIYLSQALAETLQGDPAIAFFLADAYYRRDESGVYAGNLIVAFTAYNCMDSSSDVPPEQQQAAEAEVAAEAPTVSPYWFRPNTCDQWPYPAVGTPGEITADGAAPIVVIGTTNDPATPYESAVDLADQLSSGVLVTLTGEGHTAYNKGNSCVDSAVVAYFTEGTVPPDGLECR